jgi:hypothetical protein
MVRISARARHAQQAAAEGVRILPAHNPSGVQSRVVEVVLIARHSGSHIERELLRRRLDNAETKHRGAKENRAFEGQS